MRKSGGVLKLDATEEVEEVAGDGCVEEEMAEYMLDEPEVPLEEEAPLVMEHGWERTLAE